MAKRKKGTRCWYWAVSGGAQCPHCKKWQRANFQMHAGDELTCGNKDCAESFRLWKYEEKQ